MDKPLVLVVDDDEFIVDMVREALQGNCRVKAAEDGWEAIACLDDEKPAMIIVDVDMPRMDGYELCRRVKARAGYQDTPVLFLSGMDEVDDLLKGYEAGGDDYVTKPFRLAVLGVKVQTLLTLAEQRRTLRDASGQATRTAMTAISNMGALLGSLRSFNGVESLHELARCVADGLKRYELDGRVQLRACGEKVSAGSNGPLSPLDESVLEQVAGMDRQLTFRSRLALNSDGATLLINNMPVDDDVLYGRLRDHLSVLMEGVEVRLHGLESALRQQRQQDVIGETITRILDMLETLGQSQKRQHLATVLVSNDVMTSVEKALVRVAVTDEQERYVIATLREGLDSLARVQGNGTELHSRLSEVVSLLRTVAE